MHHPLYSIGHSNHSSAHVCTRLSSVGIECVLDVRRFPVSRRWPQFDLAPLQTALAAAGIAYVHLPALGGRRDALGTAALSNAGLEDAGLRAYADYAQTPGFLRAMETLLAHARNAPTAMLCAEADWRNCHRQIIADHALLHDIPVQHLLANGSSEPAALNPLALTHADGRIHYPGRQPGLFDHP